MTRTSKTKITALWVGEKNPDLFSRLIQFVLRTNYSHNCFLFENEIWHGTLSDDPKYNGFCNEPIERALKGCIVRACAVIEIDFGEEEFRGYLRARKGTPYSMIQNLWAVRPVVYDIPIIKYFFKNGKSEINCSEVLAEVCQGGKVVGRSEVLQFGENLDKIKPTDTFSIIKPELCNHAHSV